MWGHFDQVDLTMKAHKPNRLQSSLIESTGKMPDRRTHLFCMELLHPTVILADHIVRAV
jgi:hypothetical protein